jgi:hypothetical protein
MLSIGLRVTADHHVVMQADATPLQPNSITHAVTLFMKKRGSEVRLHGIGTRTQHICSRLLAANIHPKIVSGRLHSKVGITLDLLQPRSAGNAGGRGKSGGRNDIGRATGAPRVAGVAKWYQTGSWPPVLYQLSS